MSRNWDNAVEQDVVQVAPREGRVSRNGSEINQVGAVYCRAPRGACE